MLPAKMCFYAPRRRERETPVAGLLQFSLLSPKVSEKRGDTSGRRAPSPETRPCPHARTHTIGKEAEVCWFISPGGVEPFIHREAILCLFTLVLYYHDDDYELAVSGLCKYLSLAV